jgi:predicted mannosyl-3-phosphoglycerate phosphatase (HAD superfamily)
MSEEIKDRLADLSIYLGFTSYKDVPNNAIALITSLTAELTAARAEVERLRGQIDTSRKYWMRDAKEALAGDPRRLANRIALIEAGPVEWVQSDAALTPAEEGERG